MGSLSVVITFLLIPFVTDAKETAYMAMVPEAIVDIMDSLHWRDAIFIYDGLFAIKDRQSMLKVFTHHRIGIISLQINASHSGDITSVVSAIQGITVTSILLYIKPTLTQAFLKQAKNAGMIHRGYSWLVVCQGRTQVRSVEEVLPCSTPGNVAMVIPSVISSSGKAVDGTCLSSDNTSAHHLTQSSSEGVPVPDPPNTQMTISVYSCQLNTAGFRHVATWTSQARLHVFAELFYSHLSQHLFNASLRVGAWVAEPFLIRQSKVPLVYEGFCITVLDEMARRLNFTYQLFEPKDGKYGAPRKNGTWNGMIGMLLRGEIDLAVGPFTITADRMVVVDFTLPYMEDGGGILTKGGDSGPDLLNVFRPFSPTVWLLMATSVIAAAACLFLVIRGRDLPVICHCHRQQQQDQERWTFQECFTIMYASLMNQGISRQPDTSPGRLVLGIWWLFTILIVSIYTASEAAMLTVRKETNRVNSIHDLAASSLDPVTIAGSSWWTLFANATNGIQETIGARMAKAPVVRVNEDALKLVYAGKAAFVVDVNQVSYMYSKDCQNLYMAKTIFNSNGLGFAMPKNSFYRHAMNYMILKLQEGGFLDTWRKQWWRTPAKCNTNKALSIGTAKQLKLESIGGILIVYFIIIALAIICHVLHYVLCMPCCARVWQSVYSKRGKGGETDTESQSAGWY